MGLVTRREFGQSSQTQVVHSLGLARVCAMSDFRIMAKLLPNSHYGQITQAAKYPSGFCETRVFWNLSIFMQSDWSKLPQIVMIATSISIDGQCFWASIDSELGAELPKRLFTANE
jgi:hypothetical protein